MYIIIMIHTFLNLEGDFSASDWLSCSAQYNRIYRFVQVYRVKGDEVIVICLRTVKYLFP